MTDNPIFQEIDEDLERQKMEALWKRYGIWIIIAAVLLVAATGGYTFWQSWRAGEQQKQTSALMDVLSDKAAASDKQITALQDIAAKDRGDVQGAMATLHAAALAAKDGDSKQAIALYDGMAGDDKIDSAFRQLADLLSVQAQMDDGDPVVLQKRLQPLLADNAPWRYTAMEDDAFLALRAGDKSRAKQIFTELAQDASAPQDINGRASDMLRFIDD